MRPILPGILYPASPTFLEDALVNAIKGYTANFPLTTPRKDQNDRYIKAPPAVWTSSIAAYLTGFDPQNAPPNFPGVVVQMCKGKITAHDATATVKILVGIFDPDLEKQGFRSVNNLMYQIANGFWYDSMIDGVFSLDFRETTHLELFELEKVDMHPFYFGTIEQTFLVLKPQDKFFDNVHTVDFPPGNRDFPLPTLPPDV